MHTMQATVRALARLTTINPAMADSPTAKQVLFDALMEVQTQTEIAALQESHLLADSIETVAQRRFDSGVRSAFLAAMVTMGVDELRVPHGALASLWTGRMLNIQQDDVEKCFVYRIVNTDQEQA